MNQIDITFDNYDDFNVDKGDHWWWFLFITDIDGCSDDDDDVVDYNDDIMMKVILCFDDVTIVNDYDGLTLLARWCWWF